MTGDHDLRGLPVLTRLAPALARTQGARPAFPSTRVRIVTIPNHHDVADDVGGCASGPPGGYWNQDDETAWGASRPERLRTGDLSRCARRVTSSHGGRRKGVDQFDFNVTTLPK